MSKKTYTPPPEEEVALNEADIANNFDHHPVIGEKPVHRFCATRQNAALMMGMRYSNFTEEDLKQLNERGFYNSLYNDIIIVSYLCSHELEVAFAAKRAPLKAAQDADVWADENGIYLNSVAYAQCAEFFTKTVTNLNRINGPVKDLNPTTSKNSPKNS